MSKFKVVNRVCIILCLVASNAISAGETEYVVAAGHPSLQEFVLPDMPVSPADNPWTKAKAELGKKLFFDQRLSGTGKVSCSTCHIPELGWEDGLPLAMRFGGKEMQLASPTITNLGFNTIYMWDGRMPTLEKQAFAGQGIKADINAGMDEMGLKEGMHIDRIKSIKGYQEAFARAFPGESAESQISRENIAKALAAFERTVVSNNSPFDKWVKGDKNAMNVRQIKGFKLFVGKANCIECHTGGNFTDNGFHNIGLKSFADPNHHKGRLAQIPKHASMDGAFKTPTLRDIEKRAPYFHDGSAKTLMQVIEHYDRGGDVKTNLSPSIEPLKLSLDDKLNLVYFLEALTSESKKFEYPVLPK